MSLNINEDLSKMDIYKNKKCTYCGRMYPETLLNIEGVIHHHEPYRCLDQKSCKRAKKKLLRKLRNKIIESEG